MPTAHCFTIPPDHPSLAGHFPGRPIVPGVILIEQLVAPLPQLRGGRIVRLEAVKFLAPVLPGEQVTVEISSTAPDRIACVGKVAGITVVRCRVLLGPSA